MGNNNTKKKTQIKLTDLTANSDFIGNSNRFLINLRTKSTKDNKEKNCKKHKLINRLYFKQRRTGC